MGVVYRGRQLSIDKVVAIKVLTSKGLADSAAQARFRREAALASKLIHPGIAQVLDYGVEGETPFLVMEYVEGVDLSDVLSKEGAQPPLRAITMMRQITSVLQEAARQRVLHRDLKPSNIRLMRYTRTGPLYLKVLDFGIAKQLGHGDMNGTLTATGEIMGTPLYLSPEQAGLEVPEIDMRADQYSAGVIFYELLAGKRPFLAHTLPALIHSHITKTPPPLPDAIPGQVRDVVLKMLAKQPDDRYSDPAALDRALAACEELYTGGTPPARARKATAAGPAWTPLVAGLLGAAVLVAAVEGLKTLRARRDRTTALPIKSTLQDTTAVRKPSDGDVAVQPPANTAVSPTAQDSSHVSASVLGGPSSSTPAPRRRTAPQTQRPKPKTQPAAAKQSDKPDPPASTDSLGGVPLLR